MKRNLEPTEFRGKPAIDLRWPDGRRTRFTFESKAKAAEMCRQIEWAINQGQQYWEPLRRLSRKLMHGRGL